MNDWCKICKWNPERWVRDTTEPYAVPGYCETCTQRTNKNNEPSQFVRLSPGNGDGKRCEVHGCWCIIMSVSDKEWDADWLCPKCNPEYLTIPAPVQTDPKSCLHAKHENGRWVHCGACHDINEGYKFLPNWKPMKED